MKFRSVYILAALLLLSCSDAKWKLTDISGHLPNLKFSAVSDSGKIVSERNYKGQMVLLYFGFTGCGAECPLTLARLKPVLAKFDNVRLLFVTVDSQNDTPEILHSYLAAYDLKHMTGLTGRQSEIEKLAKSYRIAYRPSDGGHSNVIFIFDKRGKAQILATVNDTDQQLIHDLKILADE